MPTSHDQKPRNAARRLKYDGRTKPRDTQRSDARRRLRRLSQAHAAFEGYIRAALSAEGRNWRWFEQAPRGEEVRIRANALDALKNDPAPRCDIDVVTMGLAA